jgi:hypothetical protein
VADPWDVPPKPADLPDPELNPLMNPTLGKNLGRWAQVYFTNSPETREQAVGQLLRELERGEPVGAYPANNGEPIQKNSASRVLCPRCNEWNSVDQNFCGICGTRIPAVPQQPQAPRVVSTQEPRQNPWRPAASSSEDPAWLRESLFSADEEPQPSSRKAWIFAVLALLLILGGAAYLQYAPEKRSSTTTPPAAPADSDSAAPTSSQPTAPTPAASSAAASPEPTSAATTASATPEPKAPEKTENSAQKESLPKDETASIATAKTGRESAPRRTAERAPSVDDGSRELAEAQHLLQGAGTTRNPEVAAALLWKSVRKENAGAEVQLAELYAHGQGVGKNCEQARLLLTAAAKKGASDAAQKLRQLQSGGCQ